MSESEHGDWVAVYYTDDGPFVYGPFARAEDAREHVISFYMGEYGITEVEANERYEESGDEWVTRLQEVVRDV